MTQTRKCYDCKEVKPLTEFSRTGETGARARAYQCKTCHAAYGRKVRAELPPGELAARSKAHRAGMRKDKCAVCATAIDGQGICTTCWEIIEELGGLEGLKRAVRAVRYLTEK